MNKAIKESKKLVFKYTDEPKYKTASRLCLILSNIVIQILKRLPNCMSVYSAIKEAFSLCLNQEELNFIILTDCGSF